MRPPRKRSQIPLAYRLANAPPGFVGREVECERLAAMLLRSPVSVVHGVAGIGKTALVLETLHRAFADKRDGVLFVGLKPATPSPVQPATEIVRALAIAKGARHVDWGSLYGRDDLPEAILDLAESSAAWVVLDDFHFVAPEFARTLLELLHRYARQSRWCVVGRTEPGVEALRTCGQVLTLGSLPPDALYQLASTHSPDLTPVDVRRLVRQSGGSPWHLKHALLGEVMSETARAAELWAAIAPARPLAERMLVMKHPLSLELLSRIVPGADRSMLDLLERHGVVERKPAGYCVHESASAVLAPSLRTEETRAWRLSIADTLAALSEPNATLEAAHHLLTLGEVSRAAALLERDFSALIASGQVTRLWALLAEQPALRTLRLRCAVEYGHPEALRQVAPPEPGDCSGAWYYARALLMLGRFAEVVEQARIARRLAHSDTAVAFEAAILEGRALYATGSCEEAYGIFSSLAPRTPADRLRVAAYQMRCLADLGRLEEAKQMAQASVPHLSEADLLTRIEVCTQIGISLLSLGHSALAASLFSLVPIDAEEEEISGHTSILFWIAQTGVALSTGDFNGARRLCDKLHQVQDRYPYLQPVIDYLEYARRVGVGEMKGLEGDVERLVRVAAEREDAFLYQLAVELRAELAMLRGTAPASEQVEARFLDRRSITGIRCELTLQRHALRHDVAETGAALTLDPRTHRDLQVWEGMCTALRALRRGDAASAVAACRHAVDLARALGHDAFVVVVGVMLGDLLLCAERFAEAAAWAEEMCVLAERFSTPRFAMAARFQRMLAQPPVEPAFVETIARSNDVVPDACRRARALLGGAPPLDVVDRGVLRAVRHASAYGFRSLTRSCEQPWRPGFGLDLVRDQVWFADGRVVSLQASPLLRRVLCCLAEAGGRVTNAELIRQVWGVAEFDPLSYRNRLHTTINKLRHLIEDDPAQPRRLLTFEDGYCVNEEEPLRIFSASIHRDERAVRTVREVADDV